MDGLVILKLSLDGSKYEMSYNESWGTILTKTRGFRCKICPDGIGMLADIAVGDSWSTKDGYPDFTESEGKCFCMVRTNIGSEIMNAAENKGYIEVSSLDLSKVKEQQRYQYERRKYHLLIVGLASIALFHRALIKKCYLQHPKCYGMQTLQLLKVFFARCLHHKLIH